MSYHTIIRDGRWTERIVNRNNDAVELILIGARAVVRNGEPTPTLGTGSFLRVGRSTPEPGTMTESGLAHANWH